jgi:HEAT repeat protein
MKKLLLLGALLASGTLCLQNVSTGHGGTYRGPGDTVPPGAGGGTGGGGPATPGPGGPSTPGPSAPGTPAPGTPGAPAGAPGGGAKAPTTGGDADGGADLTLWDFWWGFNKDPYLNLKARIHDQTTLTGSDNFFLGHGEKEQAKNTLRPSEAQIRESVVPALLNALDTERANDILTGALIALAKIGDVKDESGESQFQKKIASFLSDSSQEVAETAAISLGILADERSVEMLVALMKDEPAGRKLVGKNQVPLRTRAFASYGLGLIGYRTSDNVVRQLIAEHLVDILESPHFAQRDIKVAAMISFGLTGVDPVEGVVEIPEEEQTSNRRHVVSRQAQLAFLMHYFDQENERAFKDSRHYFVRAHAPTAMARLLNDEALAGEEWSTVRMEVAKLLLDAVDTHSKYKENELQQSATLALGHIGTAAKDKGINDKIRDELTRIVKDGEQQSRRFALISLAQSGGRSGDGENGLDGLKEVRDTLTSQMSKGKTQIKPWAGLAVGVLGRALLDAGESLDAATGLALQAKTDDCIRPDEIGAFVLALGLRRDLESKDLVVKKMDRFTGSDEARGHCAVALGLMEDRTSIEPIQDLIRNSKYRPELLKQAAIALGLLGDKELVPELIKMLGDAKGLATQAAISSALGAIGDSRSIEPLVDMLGNKQLTDTARGFAAVALGIVCDKEDFPWNSKIATNINYRANTVTLTGENGTGILDIL